MIKTTLETKRLLLKLLDDSFCNEVSDFLVKNKDFFAPFETIKNPIYYSPIFQKSVLDREYKASISKEYLRYYVLLKNEPDHIIGTVSFGNITPFPYCSCIIGYKFDEDYNGFGYATESITSAISTAFTYLNLHRINAYILPNNLPSIKLIERLGFNYEGLCESNIQVQGKWQSHRLYSLINPLNGTDMQKSDN